MWRLVSRDREPSAGRRHVDRHIRRYPDTCGHVAMNVGYSFAPEHIDSKRDALNRVEIIRIRLQKYFLFGIRKTSITYLNE